MEKSKKLRLSLEGCKVCQNADCTGDSLQIIENACFDSTQLGCPTILGYFPLLLIPFTGSLHFLNSFPRAILLDILETVVFIDVDTTFYDDNNQ